MVFGKLYTHGLRYLSIPALVESKSAGKPLDVVESEKEPDLSNAGVSGFPAFVSADGVQLVGSFPIAYYLSGENCKGKTPEDRAHVIQWASLCDNKLVPAINALVLPSMGLLQPITKDQAKSKEDVTAILTHANQFLEDKTFLVGERPTVADVYVAAHLVPLFEFAIDAAARKSFGNVVRWFLTVTALKPWRDAVGAPTLCEKAVPFDSKKFAELQKKSGGDAEGKGKKEEKKKETKPAEKENKPAEKPKKEADEEEDDEPKEKERPDPFKALPTSATLNMDEWKRMYSNNDKETIALPWFWTKFDPDCYSLWVCEYLPEYAKDLKRLYMTSNLINGMYQRLEKMMRNAFATMCIFGEDNNNTIGGLWIWKGQDLAFKLDEDWQTDFESYSWKKLDPKAPETKALVENFWIGRDAFEFSGRKINQIKSLK